MPFHRVLFIGCLLGLHSPVGAEPIRIVAAAASPVHATEVFAILNQPVDSATVENQLVFFLDDRDRQSEGAKRSRLSSSFRVRFPFSSRLQPIRFITSISACEIGYRAPVRPLHAKPSFTVSVSPCEAERILAAQYPDGSIPLHYRSGADPEGEPVTVISYF
jgi:hypothetical protein